MAVRFSATSENWTFRPRLVPTQKVNLDAWVLSQRQDLTFESCIERHVVENEEEMIDTMWFGISSEEEEEV